MVAAWFLLPPWGWAMLELSESWWLALTACSSWGGSRPTPGAELGVTCPSSLPWGVTSVGSQSREVGAASWG